MSRKQTANPKRRTKIEVLPTADKKLDSKDMKRVKGGVSQITPANNFIFKPIEGGNNLVLGKGPLPN